MSFRVQLKGADVLEKKIKRMSEPEQVFDVVVRSEAARSLSRVIRTTPRKTGDTARQWTNVSKEGPSRYTISNRARTKDRKYYVAKILDEGRKTVLPKRAKRLYIPLTNKGAAKDPSSKFGVDFVLAKKSKAVPATNFIRDEKIKSRRELTKAVIKKIRRVHSGR